MLAAVDRVEALDRYTVRFTVAKGTVRLVPRHDRQPDDLADHRPGVRGEVRRPEEGRSHRRHRAVDARQLPAECRFHAGPPPRLFSPGSASHRPDRGHYRRGQCLASGGFPGRQVRPRLGRRGRHQSYRLERREGPAQAAPPESEDRRVSENVGYKPYMRTDKPPFSDVRVRRAISQAINRQELIAAVGADGVGQTNAAVPAALKDWALPVDQLGETARSYRYDPAEARRLLAEAGHPRGILDGDGLQQLRVDLHGRCGHQLILKDLKRLVGIEAKLNQKEYGAYIATTVTGNYEGMYYGATTPFPPPRQLPLHQLPPWSPPQRGQGQRPRSHGSAGAPAAHAGSRRATALAPRHPAPCGR